jgi:hypothetical protein
MISVVGKVILRCVVQKVQGDSYANRKSDQMLNGFWKEGHLQGIFMHIRRRFECMSMADYITLLTDAY